MSRLMVSCNLLFLIGNDAALFLCADADLDESLLNILLADITAVFLRRHDRRFVQQILQIRSGKARRGLRDLL